MTLISRSFITHGSHPFTSTVSADSDGLPSQELWSRVYFIVEFAVVINGLMVMEMMLVAFNIKMVVLRSMMPCVTVIAWEIVLCGCALDDLCPLNHRWATMMLTTRYWCSVFNQGVLVMVWYCVDYTWTVCNDSIFISHEGIMYSVIARHIGR